LSLNRRQFLRRGAIAVAGVGLVRPNLVTAATTIFTRGPAKKVVILGAGMAGLVAGYELSQLGHDVIILEAQMRPGGRVHTLREPFSDGLYAEAGAARIPDNHDLTLKYVKLFDVPLDPMYPNRLSTLRFDGDGRREVPPEGFTEALGQNFGNEMGGSPSRWHKIKGGSDMLPKAFAQRLASKIQYGSPVVKIEQDAKSARVTYLHGATQQTISADRILCTIPFSVLRDIELKGLSARKIDVINNARYAAVSRVYVQSRNRFWESKGLSGFAFTKTAVEIWQPTWNQPGPRGILMTYARPGEAERVSILKESDRVPATLTQLDEMFPGLRDNFEGGTSKCWMEDQWARGAWSFVGERAFDEATSSEGNRIHFAGEHLSQWSSWMQGALSSGLRAVKEIDEAG